MKEILIKCNNCNGNGYIPHYDYNCQGICFKCNGTGKVKQVELTPEEIKQKEDRIKNKLFETLKELRGFRNTNVLYIVVGNTYEIKNQLKQDGAKWNMYFRAWTFKNNRMKDKYELIERTFESTLL